MTDDTLRFSVKWAGSNKIIASRLLLEISCYPVVYNCRRLQEQVGALVNINPRSIKILLGSPAGPQLTPVPLTPKKILQDLPSHKAMVKAWSSLNADQVFNVYVTQHSPVAVAIDDMTRSCRGNSFTYSWFAYANLPLALQRNPVVALAALDLRYSLDVSLPEELKNNKQFALAAISQTGGRDMLAYLSDTLCDDEEVVLKAVESDNRAMFHASSRLQKSKMFALKAVSINGLCIYDMAEFRSDKDVALAALRQNKQACICNTLEADKDIQQVYRTALTDTDHS